MLKEEINRPTEKRYFFYRHTHNPRDKSPKRYLTRGGVSQMEGLYLDYAINYAPNLGKIAPVMNQALRDLYDQLDQANEFAVSWIQRQQAIDLVADRLLDVLRIAKSIKKKSILRSLRRKSTRGGWQGRARDFGDLWLEHAFAWAPLMGDVEAAWHVFDQELPSVRCKGTSSGAYSISNVPLLDYWGIYQGTHVNASVKCKVACKVDAVDPNLNLADRLGILKPFSVAWELLPWSFLVDYVFNIGEMISDLEPRFPGLTITEAYNTRFTVAQYKNTYFDYDGSGIVPLPFAKRPAEIILDEGRVYEMSRNTGLPFFAPENRIDDLTISKLANVCALFLGFAKTA